MLSKILNQAHVPSRFLAQTVRMHSSNSIFSHVPQAPADPILGLSVAFAADTNPNKVLLGMGAYRDDEGKPYILDCVREAEERLFHKKMNHEYAAIDGIASYRDKCVKLAFGEDSSVVKDKRYAAMQTLSGTGSLRVGFDFLKEWYTNKNAKIYIPDPTWPTHRGIGLRSGF